MNVLWSSLVSRSTTTAEAPPPSTRSVNTVSPVVRIGWPGRRVATRTESVAPGRGWKLITRRATWHARGGPDANTPVAAPCVSRPGGDATVLLYPEAPRLVPTFDTPAVLSAQSCASVV